MKIAPAEKLHNGRMVLVPPLKIWRVPARAFSRAPLMPVDASSASTLDPASTLDRQPTTI